MKKGCIIAICSLFLIAAAGIFTVWWAASQYEKQPKKPGEAELWAAEEFIRMYESSESSGNTPEAVAFADQFSRSLRVSRQFMFTEGKAGGTGFTKGRFITYCFLRDDSVAVVVHIPELRRYTEDAKVTLEEFAWSLATSYAALNHPDVEKLALGVKGALNYSAIITGEINDEDPLKGIEVRHPTTSTESLWPFFLPEENKANKPEMATPRKPSD